MDLPEELSLIHQPVRLQVMGLLYKHRDVAFTRVRDLLDLTDGNLASHAGRLEDAGFLEARDALMPEGFQKRYRITQAGSAAFKAYLQELEGFLSEVQTRTVPAQLDPTDGEPG